MLLILFKIFPKITQTENDSVQFFCAILCNFLFFQPTIFTGFFDNPKKIAQNVVLNWTVAHARVYGNLKSFLHKFVFLEYHPTLSFLKVQSIFKY